MSSHRNAFDQGMSDFSAQRSLHSTLDPKNLLLAAVFAAWAGVGCQPSPQSKSSAIIGSDDRTKVENVGDTEKAVGFLMTPQGPCTAFLTAANEITTAAHCFNPATKDLQSYLFVVPAAKKESFVASYLEEKSSAVEARLVLKERFEHHLEKGDFDSSQSTSIVSFSFDSYQLWEHKACAARLNTKDRFLTHQCDTVPGASGSPILQDGKVVGIHQGYSQKLERNTASLIQNEKQPQQSFAEVLRQTDRLEVSCDTNCSHHCRRKVLGTWIANPICEGTCNLERGVQCGIETVKRDVVRNVLNEIQGLASRDGWSKATCVAVGTPPILLASGAYITPACAAAGAATVGWGIPACVTAMTGAIVTAVCTQLCEDKHLSDCQ